ncbi:LysE family translocator [Sneathiella marina]|uniref:LysE family translocator n=1 Tax=Sneathiella marina TaxID=2950108 RepID=A0ABY4W633_9PROT|nr:LysE family translocator [Sneathiella marina]USG62645.1 LysE family translocator [Sneathiella marina]
MEFGKIALIAMFAISMVGSPGPVNMALMASGASFGYRRSLPFLVGSISGFLLVCLAVALGLGSLFVTFPTLQVVFLFVSVLYIIYLAFKVATASPEIDDRSSNPGYLAGVILHPLNPKAWVTIIAAYSQFVSPTTSYVGQVITIMLIFAAVSFPLNSIWCYGGNVLRRLVKSTKALRVINIALAILMVVAVTLALLQADILEEYWRANT